jgi:hypothetical protein
MVSREITVRKRGKNVVFLNRFSGFKVGPRGGKLGAEIEARVGASLELKSNAEEDTESACEMLRKMRKADSKKGAWKLKASLVVPSLIAAATSICDLHCRS